jgi:acyl-CoA hydrolase
MVMKLMDTCAGLSALRHCNSNVVTLKVCEWAMNSPGPCRAGASWATAMWPGAGV